jgi:hypothetical protein
MPRSGNPYGHRRKCPTCGSGMKYRTRVPKDPTALDPSLYDYGNFGRGLYVCPKGCATEDAV